MLIKRQKIRIFVIIIVGDSIKCYFEKQNSDLLAQPIRNSDFKAFSDAIGTLVKSE